MTEILSFALGVMVMLSPGPFAGRQPLPDQRPLPDVNQLLMDVSRNQKRIDSLVDPYTCTETDEENELNGKGEIKRRTVKEYEVFFFGGEAIKRLTKKDGRPLKEGDQKKEDDRAEKRIREIQKRQAKEEREAASAKKQKEDRADISAFLRISTFTHPRRDQFRGHEVIVFDFTPNPGYRPRNRTEDVLHKLVGTLWVDDQAHQVVRLEAHLSDSLKVGGGLLASVRKGGLMAFEQEKVNEEVWLPTIIEFHLTARVLFSSLAGDFTMRFSNYKKFRVSSVIKPNAEWK
jgi:hypothetical protein